MEELGGQQGEEGGEVRGGGRVALILLTEAHDA